VGGQKLGLRRVRCSKRRGHGSPLPGRCFWGLHSQSEEVGSWYLLDELEPVAKELGFGVGGCGEVGRCLNPCHASRRVTRCAGLRGAARGPPARPYWINCFLSTLYLNRGALQHASRTPGDYRRQDRQHRPAPEGETCKRSRHGCALNRNILKGGDDREHGRAGVATQHRQRHTGVGGLDLRREGRESERVMGSPIHGAGSGGGSCLGLKALKDLLHGVELHCGGGDCGQAGSARVEKEAMPAGTSASCCPYV
jgi:hypothetical protein